MAKGVNQKLKLPLLERILLRETDDNHPITVQEFVASLGEMGVGAERKSIYDDMEALRKLGLDVQSRKGRSPGWFIGERTFELTELKLLVDAVQSSRFITRKKSDVLIRKLETLTSRHLARALQRQVYVSGRVKTMNEGVYCSIDKLHAAISAGKAVTFRYFEYNVKKEKVFRREGARYKVSPYGLIWESDNCYLAGYDHLHHEMRHYRVDKMWELAITCLPRQGDENCRQFDLDAYAQRHFGMFPGREAQVSLRCENGLVGVVLDRFGQDVILVPDGNEHFTVTVPIVITPPFLGWLFSLGTGIELLKPAWVVEELRGRLAALEQALLPPPPG